MNTHNVNGTASESTETWTNELKVNLLSRHLGADLDFLASLSRENLTEEDREELLLDVLTDIAEKICDSVTDWSEPRPFLSFAVVQAWMKARHIAMTEFGELGEAIWHISCNHLKEMLEVGHDNDNEIW